MVNLVLKNSRRAFWNLHVNRAGSKSLYIPGTVNTNFKKPASQGFIRDTARRFELSSLFFISIICLVFALTTIFNIFREGIPDLARNINIAIGVVFILIAAFFGYIAYIKKKENIKEN